MPSEIVAVIFDMDLTLVDTSSLAQLRLQRNWSEVYRRIPETSVYPGVPQILRRCRQLNLKVGIVTTAPSTYCNRLIRYHGIGVDATVCYHDVAKGRTKPEPDQMLLCAQKLNVEASSCLTLGDDPRDILASRRAGMVSVAALWGATDPHDLLAVEPTHACNTPSDFVDLLDRLSG